MATTQTLTATFGPDVCISKPEVFDVRVARWLYETKDLDVPTNDRSVLSRMLRTGSPHQTIYKLGATLKYDECGRFIAQKTGLQLVSRRVRNALAERLYWDVDMKNAQPTILEQLATRRGWVCTAVKQYGSRREAYLAEVMDSLGIDRDEAKKRVNALFFGGSPSGLPSFFVNELAPELRTLIKNLCDAFAKTYPKEAKRGALTLAACVLQTEERKILVALDQALGHQDRSLDTYIHDGGLVRKKEGETEFPAEILRKVEADVLASTGYAVEFAVKPMTTPLMMPEEGPNGDGEYAKLKTAWEQTGWKGATWFKLRHPPCFVAMFPDGTIDQMSRTDLLQNEEDNILGSGDLFIKRWLADDAKRWYERLVFAPKQETPPDRFNLFQGFANEPTEGDFSAYTEALRLVSGNDPKVAEYMENWLAHILQKPSQKTKVAIVIQGEQGIGKDSYCDAVGDFIIGKKYYLSTKTPENDIFAKFNARASYKLLVKFEEADFHTNKENASKLKALITSSKGHVEKKGHDPIELDDYTNIMMTTNNETPVVIEDTDRRFMLVKASSEKLGDTPFWDDLHAKFPVQSSAYHAHLLSKDLSSFIPWDKSTIPKTQYYNDVKQSFLPYHAKFFQHQVELEMAMEWSARNLFSRMKAEAPVALQLSETRFGRDMRLYVEAGVLKKTRANAYNHYEGDATAIREFLVAKGWWVEL